MIFQLALAKDVLRKSGEFLQPKLFYFNDRRLYLGEAMNKQIKNFHQPIGFDDVYILNSAKLWSIIIRLSDGSLCVYSPLKGLKAPVIESIKELGDVSFILAPNHYHNKGIADHLDLFPDADLVCSDTARPRLIKQTGAQFSDIDNLIKQLPKHIRILEPEGLKTGEVWFEVKKTENLLWVVCDAFSSERQKGNKYRGTLSMLKTFPKYGVQDAETYKAWIKKLLSSQVPHFIVPCHGAPVEEGNLKPLITDLLDHHI